MTVATMLTDADQRVTRIAVPPNEAPKARDGFVGWIAEGWAGDPVTGHPVWWFKLSDSQWGPMISAPLGEPGPAGPTGPAGSLAPHVPGSDYTASVSTVVVARTVWQCTTTHTAAAEGDGTRSAFELDAVDGLWAPVGAQPVQTFDPHLATTSQPLTDGSATTHLYLRQTGTAVVNRFRFSCSVAAGNVAVGVQRGTGGGASTPGDVLAWWSGLTPAVATSDTQPPQEIVVPGGIVVYAGDFLVFSCDDGAAEFLTVGGTADPALATLFEGAAYAVRLDPGPVDPGTGDDPGTGGDPGEGDPPDDDPTGDPPVPPDLTPPADASGLTPVSSRGPLLIGRP